MRKLASLAAMTALIFSCTKIDNTAVVEAAKGGAKESVEFKQISAFKVGGAGAAEISAYCELTKKLFVVNNTSNNNRIDVISLSNPAAPVLVGSISTAPYGGGFVNSVDVLEGKLAAGIEAAVKTNNGEVVVLLTDNYNKLAEVIVGALPDMVTFSPDGKFILSANEGEPNDAYTIDPIGSVSIIDIENNYAVKTLDFSGFASQEMALKARGFRIYGKNASFAQDIEPEYIAIAANSKKAWVTLQENNGIARIDLNSQTIEEIMPLGFKDYSLDVNAIDPSDNDGGIFFNPWPVYGMYEPDGIAVIPHGNVPFVFTANEGDSREYAGFNEMNRVNNASFKLDPNVFTDASLKGNAKLGRLNVTKTLGDADGNGFYEGLYSLGARSFSIWNGLTGEQVFDSKNELDKRCAMLPPVGPNSYADARSDDKGVEPEGVVIGRVGNNNLLFVGMERSNTVFVYDVTNPTRPVYLQYLATGTAPEGLHFIPADKSPNGRSILVVSNETSGDIRIYSTF